MDTYIGFQVDPKMRHEIEEVAEYRGVSLSDVVRDGCRAAISDHWQGLAGGVDLAERILEKIAEVRKDQRLEPEARKEYIEKYHSVLKDVVNGKPYKRAITTVQ